MAGVKGRSGRKKKPTSELTLHKVERGFMRLPEFDEEGNAYFDMLFNVCLSHEILQETDEVAFNAFVVTFREWVDLYRTVRRQGKFEYDDRTKCTRISAVFRAERQLFRDLMSAAREFGLTPSSRAAALSMPKEGKELKNVTPESSFISGDLGAPLE